MAKGSFALQIAKFAEKAKSNADLVVRHTTIKTADSVVERSPVGNPDLWERKAPAGYVGGRFRANWQFGDGVVNTATTDEIDPDGSNTKTRLAVAIEATGAGGVTYISNSLPYALPLEYGHSHQTPGGMVRVTVAEFDQYVRDALSDLE